MSVEVRLDPGKIAQAFRSRNSFVARRLRARTERVADIARAEAPGSMGRFIETRVEVTSKGLSGVITSTHPATRYVIEGTKRHPIRARRRKALRFTGRSGETVFRREVMHPGTKANDFLTRALLRGR
ncbi:hypothetical protein [Streptomyces sp. G1]|uniref:hypothetical protein n=1 Tax=Streptomyces sp. G1 TaxID=361572 RepID=UPI00202ED675|nr:hypothetical protein [Streptomyces sp. G1]MCM1964832.1 hypothetical protein [Streptomyces sp. G1]